MFLHVWDICDTSYVERHLVEIGESLKVDFDR